jgi:hypothetical protein
MEKVEFKRTAQAASQERLSRWDVIAAIAADAAERELAITGAASFFAAGQAFEAAGVDYADSTIKSLCVLAKFDYEAMPKDRAIFRQYGWTVVLPFANAGYLPHAAAEFLKTPRTVGEVKAEISGRDKSPKPSPVMSFDQRCADWVNHMNAVMTEGAILAAEAEQNSKLVLGAHAEMALTIYRRLAERQLEAELRRFLEAREATR